MNVSSQGRETEAKFYVRNLRRIRQRLRSLGARLVQRRVLEENLRYDLPDARLRSAGRVLRLRLDTAARLTFKGPGKSTRGVLSRREIEFTVGNFEAARQFLEALGFEQVLRYEKYRAVYRWKTVHIMLDELPYGEFVEIEGDRPEAIRAAARHLGLTWSAAVTASYAALFERLRKRRRLRAAGLTFAAFDGMHITADELEVEPADT
jgi:adenylate cyclase class 2